MQNFERGLPMRLLFTLLLFSLTLLGAEIDTKLYDNENREDYYVTIQKQISADALSKVRDEDVIKDEIANLGRLRDVASQKIQIESYNLDKLKKTNVSIDEYYDLLVNAASVQSKLELNRKLISDIQVKLLVLKQAIERITEDEKPKLLSYQLQFAYYKIQQKNVDTKVSLLKTAKKELLASLQSALNLVECLTNEVFNEKIASLDKNIADALKETILQQLHQEKAIIEENVDLNKINKKTAIANAKYQELVAKKMALQIKELLCLLKENNSKQFYSSISDISATLGIVTETKEKTLYIEQMNILKEISKVVFGSTKLFFGAMLQESEGTIISIKEFLISPLFIFNERPISVLSLFKAITLITLGFVFGVMYKRWIRSVSTRWTQLSMMSIRLASNIGYYLIVLIFFIVGISSLGIDMSSISLIAGALSIGIGFGLQTVVSNLIAGIILMFERTIRIGDTIEINNLLQGVVTDMRIRSTTIKTFDNVDVVVPNSSFIQNNVINWTLDDSIRRLHVPFSVAYDTEVDDVKNAVLNALDDSHLIYVRNNDDKKPHLRMTMMNSSSVDFELIIWVEWGAKIKYVSITSDFLILIYNALRANKITIPFPQMDIYMREMVSKSITKEV